MAIDISFTLTENDLDYFRERLADAQQQASSAKEGEILEHVRQLLGSMDRQTTPAYVKRSLDKLRTLSDMLDDPEWPLESGERGAIVSALAYFYEPKDAVPDDVPAMGLIDDAIVTELVARELQNEIEAYEEFCHFRSISEQLGQQNISREDWLREKRHELFDRMRRRLDRQNRPHRDGGRLTGFSLS